MVHQSFVFIVYLTAGLYRGGVLGSMTPVVVDLYAHVARPFDKSPLVMSLCCTSFIFGSFLCSFIAPQLVRLLGRRSALLFGCVSSMLLNILCAIPFHWIYFALMKMMVGLTSAVILQMVPLIMAEQVSPKLRGIFSSLTNSFLQVGVLQGTVIQFLVLRSGNFKLFWVTQIAPVVWGIVFLGCSFFIKDANAQI